MAILKTWLVKCVDMHKVANARWFKSDLNEEQFLMFHKTNIYYFKLKILIKDANWR